MGYKIEFFGWCNEHPHDKVWGWVSIGEDRVLYNFWGARGKKYTFKLYKKPKKSSNRWWENEPDLLEKLSHSKMSPGRKNGTYKQIPPDQVEIVVPGFDEEFSTQLAIAKLLDNFHGMIS